MENAVKLKRILGTTLMMVFLAGMQTTAIAQSELPSDSITETAEITLNDSIFINLVDYLPPLSVLIDSAIVNSPEVAFYDARIEMRENEVIIEKKNWSEDIMLQGAYNAGSFGNAVLQQLNVGYNYGVMLQIPLSTFYGRSNRINAAEANRKSEIYKREEMKKTVKESVIETYNHLLLFQRLLKIMTEAKESSQLIAEMAEERFRDGELTLDQLGQSTDLKAKHAAEYEQLRTEFSNTYARLERLVGVPFSKFVR